VKPPTQVDLARRAAHAEVWDYELLRVARKNLGLSLDQLAELLGTGGGTTPGHWERGDRLPSLALFVRLCRALELDPAEVLRIDAPDPSAPKELK